MQCVKYMCYYYLLNTYNIPFRLPDSLPSTYLLTTYMCIRYILITITSNKYMICLQDDLINVLATVTILVPFSNCYSGNCMLSLLYRMLAVWPLCLTASSSYGVKQELRHILISLKRIRICIQAKTYSVQFLVHTVLGRIWNL